MGFDNSKNFKIPVYESKVTSSKIVITEVNCIINQTI